MNNLADFPPAYFALVMATGIVAIACHLSGIPILPQILFWINVAGYLVLGGLTIARVLRYRARFLADFSSHQRGPGFFTTVAGTSVLGVQFVVQQNLESLALILWWLALALWLVLTYAVFTALTVKEEKPDLAAGINGGWLVAVVATQSLPVLGSFLTHRFPGEVFSFLLVSLWLAGGMLYIWMIALIFYRYTFFRFQPSDLMPPYWINMGAMAISTLAGALLILNAERARLLAELGPFLRGFTLLYWATATWWIPMLLVLGFWRHVYRRFPLTYDPLYWGLVFPLGMYAVATFRLSQALEAPFLLPLSRTFVVIALVAWLLTFAGLLTTLWRMPVLRR